MCASRKHYSPPSEILSFTYPKLHTGKNWYVDFSSFDPAEGKMKRKKYMINMALKVSERRKAAAEIIEATLKNLRAGWSPWVHVDSNRGYTLLTDALAKFEAKIDKMDRYKSRKSYASRLSILREYIDTLLVKPKYVYQFNTAFVCDFLDWISYNRDCSPRTRNNYRGWCSSLAIFFMERQYIESNPVEKVSAISEPPKKRQPLTEAMLKRLSAHLAEHDPYFLLACRMEYYCFIRPSELRNVKIGDISIAEQCVVVPAEYSKNRRNGKVGLNDEIIKQMIDLGIFANDNSKYLFGKDFTPSDKIGPIDLFNKRWAAVRRKLGFDDCYQFYSLKDSGLRDLANSQGIVIARDQARHTDVSTTNKYLQGRDAPVHPETKKFKGSL